MVKKQCKALLFKEGSIDPAETLRDASVEELQGEHLRYVRPPQFKLVYRAQFHTLVRNQNETSREFLVQALKCYFQEHFDVVLRE